MQCGYGVVIIFQILLGGAMQFNYCNVNMLITLLCNLYCKCIFTGAGSILFLTAINKGNWKLFINKDIVLLVCIML